MPRKRINEKAPLTNAEKQRRYRVKQKAKLESLKVAADGGAAMREAMKTDLKTSWEPELKQARIEAERKKGRELAKRADHTFTQARTIGICESAAFFVGRGRADIAQSLLTHFMIDREKAASALEADKRTHSITLESLDKSGAWKTPPPIIK